ncbi:uncharacterized protein Bfra_006348 [Botrytis fragariae]|uniref:Uncharacterized protein n=1 Tax=Botrytis fragariae TaxID=1964551 RepID=A0A8H6B4A6_9HELO|nr:uncharacterized protein Bfra_006348 [Botrytis fragariae]KAF5879144.1 hypothetical protein Bfra_006348 [Botrytis fragariae]
MLSSIAFSQASAIPTINGSSADIAARNANHVSLYTTSACANEDKYYEWLSTATCTAPHTIAFSDGNFQKILSVINKERCVGTDTLFDDGDIGSVMFWLPAVCDVFEAVKDILGDVTTVLTAAESFAEV